MNDIVLQRFEEGKCALCNNQLEKDFKTVRYKGKNVWICKHHNAPKPGEPHLKKLGSG
jgi:hypothetical protein